MVKPEHIVREETRKKLQFLLAEVISAIEDSNIEYASSTLYAIKDLLSLHGDLLSDNEEKFFDRNHFYLRQAARGFFDRAAIMPLATIENHLLKEEVVEESEDEEIDPVTNENSNGGKSKCSIS